MARSVSRIAALIVSASRVACRTRPPRTACAAASSMPRRWWRPWDSVTRRRVSFGYRRAQIASCSTTMVRQAGSGSMCRQRMSRTVTSLPTAAAALASRTARVGRAGRDAPGTGAFAAPDSSSHVQVARRSPSPSAQW